MADLFDGVYVINMDDATARWDEMARQCRTLGLPCARVPAVDGRRLSPDDLKRVATPACRHLCPAAMIGIALSHLRVWHLAIQNNHERTLVMEDDAQLVPDFLGRARRALEDVPDDFDVLLLGCVGWCDRGREYAPWKKVVRPLVLNARDDTRTWGSVFVPEYFSGTHCYVVSRKGARKLAGLASVTEEPVDHLMNHPDLRVYAASPDLAFQAHAAGSSNATYRFPKTLGPLMDAVRDEKGFSALHYANTPILRVGALTFDGWAPVLLLLGAFGRRTWPYVAGWLLAEALVGADVVPASVSFALGWALVSVFSRIVP